MSKEEIENMKIYKDIVSDKNIYLAIYKLESYVQEINLLSKNEIKRLHRLKDKFNTDLINKTIKEVRCKLYNIIVENNYFDVDIFFRFKGVKEKDEKIRYEYRPLHTSDLNTQIAMVSILNYFIYNIDDNNDLKLSELTKNIPKNFYGNILSNKTEELYMKWQGQYSKYAKDIYKSYKKNEKSGKYKYEVNLDIKNFFPSISQKFIEQIILDKIGMDYNYDELNLIRRIINKLLKCKINKEKLFKYFKQDYFNEHLEGKYTIGIPQGLPTSYFLANLIMAEIAPLINKIFPGDSFYYVDDVVIHTNDVKVNEFKSQIELINESINEIINYKTKRSSQSKYNIKIHTEEKSNYSEITTKQEYGYNMLAINRIVSMASMEIFNSFSDSDDHNLLDKMQLISKAIDKELKFNKDLNKNNKEVEYNDEFYLKMLRRTRKFFQFRIILLEEKLCNKEINKIIKEVCDELKSICEAIEKNQHIELLEEIEENLLMSKLIYALNKSDNNNVKKNIQRLEFKILGKKLSDNEAVTKQELKTILYFSKIADSITGIKNTRFQKNIQYYSLEYIVKRKLNLTYRISNKQRKNKLIEFLNKMNNDNDIYIKFISSRLDDKYDIVYRNSNEFKRKILNTVISIIINVEISDNLLIHKLHNTPLRYYELRLLAYLKNKTFEIEKFIIFNKNIDLKDDSQIDTSIFEVLDYFKVLVRKNEYIDNLICIHKYVVDMWKQGSKNLHFYTLHNQEHAIEVIKSIQKIIRSFDFIQINSFDYYILFIASYLHDISMVICPDMHYIFNDPNNTDANLLYTEFKLTLYTYLENINENDNVNLRNLLIEYYEKLDIFFENHVRENHFYGSKRHVQKSKDLGFLSTEYRNIIADVIESHGYSPRDVYGLKSVAKNSLVSKKYMMMLLRLGDLLHMSENRITNAVLNNSIQHMSEVTKFHWISHKLIKNYEITTEYINEILDSEDIKGKRTYLSKEHMKERIVFKVYLNIAHNEYIEKRKTPCMTKWITSNNDLEIKLKIGDRYTNEDNAKCSKSCSLICRWFTNKNNYLFEELYMLQKYLDRSKNAYYFNSEIEVHLIMDGQFDIDQEHMDIIRKAIIE